MLRCVHCQANGQTKLPHMFIALRGLIDDLRVCDSVVAHDEVYTIALINRSFKPASRLSREGGLLKPVVWNLVSCRFEPGSSQRESSIWHVSKIQRIAKTSVLKRNSKYATHGRSHHSAREC